jgi:DNA-binding winged helix-turn-helix (wHTH) protein
VKYVSDSQPLLAQFHDYVLDEGNARLARRGQPVELPPKAFAVLCTLVRNGGRLVAKDVLLDTVWGHQHVSESVLKTTISQVRAALDDDPKSPQFIETASRRGYRFIATVGAGRDAVPATIENLRAPEATATPSATAPAGPELIGRNGEIAFLGRCLYLASAGSRQTVFLAGEPGIGKTAVIERFSATCDGEPITIAAGQCVEHFGSGEACMPVLEALNAPSPC